MIYNRVKLAIIAGSVVFIVGVLDLLGSVGAFGLTFGAAEAEQARELGDRLVGLIDEVITIVGGAMAVYGRVTA